MASTDNHDQVIHPLFSVLKDVVEKVDSTETPKLPVISTVVSSSKAGFPSVFSRKKSLSSNGGGSLFAQQIKKSRISIPEKGEEVLCSNLIGSSILGEAEAKKIHEENLNRLASMSKEEILLEQRNIVQNMDAKLLSFLRSKKKACSKLPPVTSKDNPNFEPTVATATPPTTEEVEMDELTEDLKKSNFVHMDRVEKDKLKHWVSSLPPIKEQTSEYFQARFDFNGCLLPVNAELPVTESGLYHHGEEPERAGYSINELLILSRSIVIQQRVLSLNTLSKILEKSRLGIYDECFKDCFIQSLLDGNMLLMLRHCLDDSNEAVIIAALEAFSHFLSSSFDETCLDRCHLWYRGEEQPSLSSHIELDDTDKEQEAEMKDNEVAKIDVIKACLQIDVLARIRYVLETIRPGPKGVLACLAILTRMSRHSAETVQSILSFPRLMDVIFTNFLPSDWSLLFNQVKVDGVRTVYGVPLPQALRLVRVMASSGEAAAVALTSNNRLMDSILSYLSMDLQDLNLPMEESFSLVLHSYWTWRVLLRYGLAVDRFLDYFPVLMKQILFYQSHLSLADDTARIRASQQAATAMILTMESVLRMCCRGHHQVHFVHISGLRQPMESCVGQWSRQMEQLATDPADSARDLVAAGIHFLATFYAHWSEGQQAVPLLHQLCKNAILSLLASDPVSSVAAQLVGRSSVAAVSVEASPHSLASIPSVSATVKGGDVVPVLRSPSPFPLLSAVLRILRVWNAKCPLAKETPLQLQSSFTDYLSRIASSSSSSLTANWFTRYELQLLHQLILLHSERAIPTDRSTVHQAALTAMTAITSGNEHVAADFLGRVVFHPHYIGGGDDDSGLEAALERMHISQPTYQSLLNQAIQQLDQVAKFYVHQLLVDPATVRLTWNYQQMIPNDWIYLPLVALYQKYLENQSTDDSLEKVVRSLQAVYCLLSLCPAWYFRIKPAEHYSRLACIFLAGNDFFLDSDVSKYLEPIMRGLLSSQTLDFSGDINGVQDFLSFYDQLLKQFEAVSYGNVLFGAFLLLPLKQRQDVKYRRKFWCEHPYAVRILTVTESRLLDSLALWLEPAETDEVLLNKYSSSLKSGSINPQRNPVLWSIATKHSQR